MNKLTTKKHNTMKNLNNSNENTNKIDSMSLDSSEITANENLERLQRMTMWFSDHHEKNYDHSEQWLAAIKAFREENINAIAYGFGTSGVYSIMEVNFEDKSISLDTEEIVGAQYVMEGIDLAYMYGYGYLVPERQTIYRTDEWLSGTTQNAMRLWNYLNREEEQFDYMGCEPKEWQIKVLSILVHIMKYAKSVLICDDEDYERIMEYLGKGISHMKIHYANYNDINIIGLI